MIWAAELVIGDSAVAPGFIPIFAVHERNRPPRPAARWLLDRSLPDRPTMQSSAMSRRDVRQGLLLAVRAQRTYCQLQAGTQTLRDRPEYGPFRNCSLINFAQIDE